MARNGRRRRGNKPPQNPTPRTRATPFSGPLPAPATAPASGPAARPPHLRAVPATPVGANTTTVPANRGLGPRPQPNNAAPKAAGVVARSRPDGAQAKPSARPNQGLSVQAPVRSSAQSSAPSGRLITSQEAMDDAARRKVFTSGADQLVRMGPAPRLFVTVCVSWPAAKRGFKDVDPADGDIKRLLSHLAGEHQAVIRAEEVESSVMITVKTTNRPTAQKIIKTLRDKLLYQAGEDDVWRTKLLFNPPADGGRPLVAVLEPVVGTTGRKILTAAPKQLSESAGTNSPKSEYKEELIKVLDVKASVLRHTTAGMRMKVQFGTVILNQWKKEKTEYTFAELETLLQRAGLRGTAQMHNLVSESSVQSLIEWLKPSNPELPELLTGFLKDGDPQRSYSIMMDTKNLHIEATFEPVYGQRSLDKNGNKGSQYALGPLSTYRLEKQLEAAEIITVCPDSSYDWTLEIRKTVSEDGTKPSPPFTVEALQRHIKFTGESLDQGFPNIHMADHFLRQHDLKNIHGKTSLKYTLGFKYVLEVNLFHSWVAKQPGKGAAAPATTTTAAVLLYSDDWEYQMRADASGARNWKDNFAEQFLEYMPDDPAPGGDVPDSTAHFLQWVDFIRKALDSGDRKKD